MNLVITCRQPAKETASALPSNYARRPYKKGVLKRRVLNTLKSLGLTALFAAVGYLGYLWNRSFAPGVTGLGVGAARVLQLGGYFLSVVFAAVFITYLLPKASACPRNPKKLVTKIFHDMIDGHGYSEEDKADAIEAYRRTLPPDSTVTEADIWKFLSLHGGQYDGIWGYLNPDKNKGWKVSHADKKSSFGDIKEIYPYIFKVNASLRCDYHGSLKVSGSGNTGNSGVKSVTYKKVLLHVEIQASFTFINAGGRWFNYDYEPQVSRLS